MLGWGHPGDWTLSEVWTPPFTDAPCPDCTAPWAAGLPACPACGLSIEEVAERLARK